MTHSQRPTSPQPDLASVQTEVADLKAQLSELEDLIAVIIKKLVERVTTLDGDIGDAELGFYWGDDDQANQYHNRIVQLNQEKTV